MDGRPASYHLASMFNLRSEPSACEQARPCVLNGVVSTDRGTGQDPVRRVLWTILDRCDRKGDGGKGGAEIADDRCAVWAGELGEEPGEENAEGE
ncbi:hypothetical protein PISL3812_09527 [Talaromyces islandicus]|uniref:Uncharacterized protein n=1 Tax=Talaromyces islandicus TaxID=28573 RepID=A0A0U1MC02_TALIS|nr:hypothetical protein PISL3812_09527 [Talaromyces islandicus]